MPREGNRPGGTIGDGALAMGLVDRVVPPAEVREQALARAAGLAAGPVIAPRTARECVDAGLETDVDTGLALERAWCAALFAAERRARGMRSFLADGRDTARFHTPRLLLAPTLGPGRAETDTAKQTRRKQTRRTRARRTRGGRRVGGASGDEG